jgi:hypothetical protein
MHLKYLDDVIELLSSEKFRTVVKDVEFNLHGTLKIDLIGALVGITILFCIWQKLYGLFLRADFQEDQESWDVRLAAPYHQNLPAEPPDSENESMRISEYEAFDYDNKFESFDSESENSHKDPEVTQDELERWNGPIINCDCDSH